MTIISKFKSCQNQKKWSFKLLLWDINRYPQFALICKPCKYVSPEKMCNGQHFVFVDFTFSSEPCGGGVGSGGGGQGSSLDQDSLGGGVACDEHEVASLTTLHIDSETSSLSHTVTVTGRHLI